MSTCISLSCLSVVSVYYFEIVSLTFSDSTAFPRWRECLSLTFPTS